jgi:hypothetical protein
MDGKDKVSILSRYLAQFHLTTIVGEFPILFKLDPTTPNLRRKFATFVVSFSPHDIVRLGKKTKPVSMIN